MTGGRCYGPVNLYHTWLATCSRCRLRGEWLPCCIMLVPFYLFTQGESTPAVGAALHQLWILFPLGTTADPQLLVAACLDYFSTLANLNTMVSMSQHIMEDLERGHHKYLAHQMALLYVSSLALRCICITQPIRICVDQPPLNALRPQQCVTNMGDCTTLFRKEIEVRPQTSCITFLAVGPCCNQLRIIMLPSCRYRPCSRRSKPQRVRCPASPSRQSCHHSCPNGTANNKRRAAACRVCCFHLAGFALYPRVIFTPIALSPLPAPAPPLPYSQNVHASVPLGQVGANGCPACASGPRAVRPHGSTDGAGPGLAAGAAVAAAQVGLCEIFFPSCLPGPFP